MALQFPLQIIKYKNANNPADPNVIYFWLKNDVYATDAHVHIDISHVLDTTTVKMSFFDDPGVDKNDALLIPGLTPSIYPFMMPQTTTYKSCIDGGIRSIVHALHAPESPMMGRLGIGLGLIGSLIAPMLRNAYYWRTSENVSPNNPMPQSAVKMRGLIQSYAFDYTQLARIGKRMLQLRLKKNWTETMDSIRFIKDLENEDPTKFVVIRNQADFNTNFADLADPLNNSVDPSDEKLRVVLQLEGLHCMDFENYRLPDSFSKDNPEASDYGGFIKSSSNSNNRLTVDTALTRLGTLVTEGVKVIVLKHFYWCGISGAGRSIPPGFTGQNNREVPTFAPLIFPLQDDHMKWRHTFKSIKNSFSYSENTHHTELGRQLAKQALRDGLILDLKHSHYDSRKQLFDMMEYGMDKNPLYNDFGNPVIDSATGDIIPHEPNAPDIENLNTNRPGSSNNRFQVMVSHAGLTFCFRDDTQNISEGIWTKEQRDAQYTDTMGIYNDEIIRIAKLGGIIGLISEDRVSRRHYEGQWFRMADDKNYPLIEEPFVWPNNYNTTIWPNLDPPPNSQEVNFANSLMSEIQNLLDELQNEVTNKYPVTQYPAYHNSSKIDKYFEERERLANAGINSFYQSFRTVVYYSERAYTSISTADLIAEYPNPPLGLDPNILSHQPLLKFLLAYRHVSLASDFDGMTDALEVYTSPRLTPVLLFYVFNRLKYDLAFKVFEEPSHPLYQNSEIYNHSSKTAEERLDELIREIMSMFIYKNFHLQLAKAQGWV
jgi:hypothetical protein